MSYTSVKMHNILNITGSSRFSSLYIIRHILIVNFKKKLITITIILFRFTILSRVVEIFNSRVKIEIDLATNLTF